MPGQVTDGLSNPILIGCIIALGGVIAYLARTIFKLQEDRRTFDLTTQQKTLEVVQASTVSMNKLSETIDSLGEVIKSVADKVKP